jgi:hypothetical protein
MNRTEAERAANRRVEIRIVPATQAADPRARAEVGAPGKLGAPFRLV